MRILRLIGLTIAQIAKQVWGLPRSFASGKSFASNKLHSTPRKPNGSIEYAARQNTSASNWCSRLRFPSVYLPLAPLPFPSKLLV